MVEAGPSLLRSLSGLADGTGRTVVISGPPMSGKSDILDVFRRGVAEEGSRLIDVRGSYRERSLSYSIATRVAEEYARAAVSPASPGESAGSMADVPAWAFAPPPALPVMSRPRLHQAGRGGPIVTAEQFWNRFVDDLRGSSPSPLTILVDDACLIDSESREFLLDLSARARLRPLLEVLVLDSSMPAYGVWDEHLAKRHDVDWLRPPVQRPDPRDVPRVHALLHDLTPLAQELTRYTALLGGSATQVALGRVTRASLSQISEALQGPVQANLLRIRADRVLIASESWIPIISDTVSEEGRREMHGQLASSLQALYPEPSLERQLEIAEHLFAHSKDLEAMQTLTRVAEVLERDGFFDRAEGCLARAVACAASLTTEERLGLEAGLRVARCRLLLLTGRILEAERELRESLGMAVIARLPRDRLEELLQSLVPVLRVVGPRPAFLNELGELADRLHDAEALAAEMLAIAVLVDYELQQGRTDKARFESMRVSRLARELPPGPHQAMALLTVASPLIEGSEEERRIAVKCIRSARTLLATYRRPDLQLYADEIHARRLVSRGERSAAISVHEQAVAVAQRARILPYELLHQIAVSGLLIDERPDPRLAAALNRSRELADRLSLTGSSPAFLQLALLEGRWEAREGRPTEAREWWGAVAEMRSPAVPPAFRAEALLRLADLELNEERPGLARGYLSRLEQPEALRALRLEWGQWFAELRARVDRLDGPEQVLPR